MKISLKVSADFEMNESGPVFHMDVSADIDGDGPDVIELERMSNEHQRAMARDAHDFMQAAGPVLFGLLASLREADPDRPAGDAQSNRLIWLEEEHRALVNRLAAIEAGRLSVHEDRIRSLEETSIPAGWRPSHLTHEETGASLFLNDRTWRVYGAGQTSPCGEGHTLFEAIHNAGDQIKPASRVS